MRCRFRDTPREFSVGMKGQITLKDCGEIELEEDEQVTFKGKDGKEFDFARKSWGYYATPSINGRLKRFGFKTALIENTMSGMKFVLVVEEDRETEFERYCEEESLRVLEWL